MAMVSESPPRRPPFNWRMFTPKLVSAFGEGYGADSLRHDAVAGLTVAIVALPLAMALAIASGTTPERGLLTAAVAGLLISLLGGSRFQIGGPTGAFVVVVYAVIARAGMDGLILATAMAAVLLIAAGLARLGTWVKYIPEPVVAGFTAGIAIIIASSQVRDFFGLTMAAAPADFLPKWRAMWAARESVSPWALAVGVESLATILLLRRFAPRAPAFLIAVVLAGLTATLGHLPVETIGSRFGRLHLALGAPRLPAVSLERLRALAPSAVTIAFLAGVESLLSAMVADGMTGRRHRSNMELIAQGVANLASALTGGIPATGAVARTATNVRAGARTPVAGILHALIIGGFLLAGAPMAGRIPLASLAAVLLVVAWSMSEPHKLARLMRAQTGERAVLLATLLLTVLVDLTVGIGVGVVLAAMIFMHRMAEAATLAQGSVIDEDEDDGASPEPADQRESLPPGVEVLQLRGPLFFGAAAAIADMLEAIDRSPRAVILRMSRAPVIDATGAGVLLDFVRRWRREGARVILSGVREQPLETLARFGMGPDSGVAEYAASYRDALAMAAEGGEGR